VENSDKTKYGSLFTGLQTQQSLKYSQYPSTLREANIVLSNLKHESFIDNTKGQKQTNNNVYKEENLTSKEKDELPVMSFASIKG
jgi:hypothetical protein